MVLKLKPITLGPKPIKIRLVDWANIAYGAGQVVYTIKFEDSFAGSMLS